MGGLFLLILGFFLPGYQLACLLNVKHRLLAGVIWSFHFLFALVFVSNLCGIPCSRVVTGGLLLLTVIILSVINWMRNGAWLVPVRPRVPPSARLWLAAALVPAAGAFGLMLYRGWYAPLTGLDASWRWNLLATQLLEHGHYGFYPPRSAEDFGTYFFSDGIPPMTAVLYFWTYAATGSVDIRLTVIPVALQYSLILYTVFALGRQVGGGLRAGAMSLWIAVLSPGLFLSVYIGQETGLTALSLIATVLFVVSIRRHSTSLDWTSAAAAAALGALSREYGGAFLVCGLVCMLWRCTPRATAVRYAVLGVILSAPWYLRNIVLTGNPFYSMQFFSLPVNSIHGQLLQAIVAVTPFFDAERTPQALRALIIYAPVPALALILVSWRDWRRRGYLTVCGIIVVLLWAYSVPRTNGGVLYSLRVLSPAFAIFSVVAGCACASFVKACRRRLPMALVWAGASVTALCCTLVLPLPLWLTKVPAASDFLRFARIPPPSFVDYGELTAHLGDGAVVINDSNFLFAYILRTGANVKVIPFWSPEVDFCYQGQPPDVTVAELRSMGVTHILIKPNEMMMVLDDHEFFRGLWSVREHVAVVQEFYVFPIAAPGE
jgi:hypothetical protein